MALAAIAFVALPAHPSEAKTGVAVSLGRIEVERPLDKGRSYTLPSLSVINPGDETSSYRLGVNYIGDQAQRKPPSRWFEFSDPQIQLPAGHSKPVTIRLRVPTSAEPGDYQALLEAELASEAVPGASVGAAAAARLTFRVKASGWGEAQWNRAKQFLQETAPWPQVVGVAAGLAICWWWLSRRFTVSVGRRR